MNILIYGNSPILLINEDLFTENLIAILRRHNHSVTLINSSEISTKNICDFDVKEFDFIIFQDSTYFYKLEKMIYMHDIPVVFICHSSFLSDRISPFRQLYKIINVIDNISHCEWGIPNELVCTINVPYLTERIYLKEITSSQIKILFLSSKHNNEYDIDLHRMLVSTFNMNPQWEFTFVCDENSSQLKYITSDNINILDFKSVSDIYKEADIIIGYRLSAIHGMLSKKPVFVAGIKGYGGMITPENYNVFKRWNFEGRFGGEIYENIPGELLQKEILFALESPNINDIINKNYELAYNDYNEYNVEKHFIDTFEDVVKLHNCLSDINKTIKLYPKISSSCSFVEDEDHLKVHIYQKFTNKYIMTISNELHYLLQMFDGTKSIIEILELNEIAQDDTLKYILDYLKALWESKLVVFNYGA